MTLYPDVKINLGLNVLRKRPDGFHDLETLFVHCSAFHDRLDIERAGSFGIEVIGADWDPRQDLCAKAYELLREDFGLPPVKIRLEKHSPVGAGLGGGSADAAYTLRALNELFSLGLEDAALAGYAARLGSDCAFFIYDKPMFGSGRGEILEPFAIDLSAYEMEVIVPEGVSVSTREAYAGIVPAMPPVPLKEVLSLDVRRWRELLANDFEKTVFRTHPEIEVLKTKLYDRGAVYASMSGSGSAVFGLFKRQ